MVKEVKVFETSDGKSFKTKQGAENHEKKLEVQKTVERLNMTEEGIAEALQKASTHNTTIRMLLKSKPDWKKWYLNHIRLISKDTLKDPDKKTIYVREYRSWGETKDKEIATEVGESFANPEKHCETHDDKYKVVRTEQVDDYTLKVVYDYKYTWEEQIKIKLESGANLTKGEISSMVYNLDEIYEEEGDEGRWVRYMTTVVDLLGDHYAIDWSRGLTESQEDCFYEQPYKAKVEEKEITIIRKYIVAVEKRKNV